MKSCRLFLPVALAFCLFAQITIAQDVIPVKGTYYGLFFESDGSWSQSSGKITVSTTPRGTYSATLQRGLDAYRFSGHFDAGGFARARLVSFFRDSLTVELQINPEDTD